MYKTIWKYSLVDSIMDLSIPEGGQPLDVQVQNGEPQLWVLVDPEAIKVNRRFVIHGTGHVIPENPGEYVATYLIHDGTYVFHVFEE